MAVLSCCSPEQKCKPVRKDIVDAVFATGYLITEKQRNISAQNEGYFSIAFVKEGDSVFAGQKLFQLDNQNQMAFMLSSKAIYDNAEAQSQSGSNLLEQLESQQLQAYNKYLTDSINLLRNRSLVSSNAVSKSDYERVKLASENSKLEWQYSKNVMEETKATLQLNIVKSKSDFAVQQQNLEHQTICSQQAGLISKLFKSEGDWVRKGESLAEIASGEFVAKLLIAEDDINKLIIGQKVYIELNTRRNFTYEACLTKIYPCFDAKEQSFIAEARFIHPIPNLKSYTQLQANIIIAQRKQALVVPSNYVFMDSLVRCSTGTQKINIGIKTAEWVKVIQGIKDDEILFLPDRELK